MTTTPQDVLDFWFDETSATHWFDEDATFDERVRNRLGDAAEAASLGLLDDWAQTPSGWLALLILLDQGPRNLYRDDARAWAQDADAQRWALSGLALAQDQQLPPLQRVFAYLPLEHAEDRALQLRAVNLFDALRHVVPPDQRGRYNEFFDYARRHHDVIARHGRFPHRNVVLGRESTAEEMDYLARPGAGF